MRKVTLASLNSWYSRFSDLPCSEDKFTPWLLDIDETEFAASPAYPEVIGLPVDIVDTTESFCQHWFGWGFYTFRTKDTVYPNIPVLLFENHNDAVIARLLWPNNKWLNTNYANIIWSSLATL